MASKFLIAVLCLQTNEQSGFSCKRQQQGEEHHKLGGDITMIAPRDILTPEEQRKRMKSPFSYPTH